MQRTAPVRAALARYGVSAAALLLLLAAPAWARFPTPFAEAASAAPIIIRARVQAVTPREDGTAAIELTIVRTFVRSFAARHVAHSELLPGMVVTLPARPEKFQKDHEYLVLLSETGSLFSVTNRCGSSVSQEVVFGTVPHFDCPGQLLWTLPEVETRLTQRSVCPEQPSFTFSGPANSLSGRPEVLSLEEFDIRELKPLLILGSLGFGLSLAAAGILALHRRRRSSALVSVSSGLAA